MLPERVAEGMTEAEGRGRLLAGFPALRHPSFRLFVAGHGISLVGFWMQSVAQGWLVGRLSGFSSLALGVVAFAAYLPILCLAPVAGVVADRVSRRRLLMTTQTLLMLLALGLGLLVVTDTVTVGLVVVIAGCVGVVSAFDVPARQSFFVEMVGPEDLPSAIALNAAIFSGARVVGPAIAGIVVYAVGEAPSFFLNAASYLAVLAALLRMRLVPGVRAAAAPAVAGFRAGLRYAWSTPSLRNLLLLLGIVSGLGLQYGVLMPVLAQRVLGASARGYGLLLTAAGVGALLAGLRLAAGRSSRAQHRRNLLTGLVTFGAGLLGLAISRGLVPALVAQAVAGYGMIRYTATTNTLLQLLVDERYRGRVMGLHTVMFLGTAPVGGLLLGALAQRYGAPAAVAFSSSVALLAAVWVAVRLRRLERQAGLPGTS